MDDVLYRLFAARAGGRCECGCGLPVPPGEVDHQWGRARQDEQETNCWVLRPECHLRKSRNEPSRRWWLERIRAWAVRWGYASAIEKADKEIAWVDAKAQLSRGLAR
jgi:5-methylcytosine-specific restriction endonuclease McrA